MDPLGGLGSLKVISTLGVSALSFSDPGGNRNRLNLKRLPYLDPGCPSFLGVMSHTFVGYTPKKGRTSRVQVSPETETPTCKLSEPKGP